MLAQLRSHRETISLWLLAVMFATACIFLGRWQLRQYQAKRDKARLVAANYDAPPVPLTTLMPDATREFDRRLEWRQVQVSGWYDPAATVLVRNRPHSGNGASAGYGYEVVVPLRLDDGSALLVDRGWLPNGSKGDTPGQAPDSVPAPAQGRVEVLARLRATEPARGGDLPRGQVASVAVPQIAAMTGYRVYPAYGALTGESPAATPGPARLSPPAVDGGEGINASYAAQWAVFALLGLGFPVWVARRRRAALAEATTAGAPGTGAGQTDVPLQPTRARRQRIWDADDE